MRMGFLNKILRQFGNITVTPGTIDAPVLVRTSADTTNPMSWQGTYTSSIQWDGVDTGDKLEMHWRVNSGAWNDDTTQPVDSTALLTGEIVWPLFDGTTFAGGVLVEVQERKVRYVAGVVIATSDWSNTVSDTMAAAVFAPSDLYGVSDVGYAFNTTDLTKMWQLNTGATAAAFGSAVGRLDDISGKGNNFASGANDAKRPALQNVSNGLLQFDGTDDRLRLTTGMLYTAGACTLMFAVRGAASATGTWIWNEAKTTNGNTDYAPGLVHLNADLYSRIINSTGSARLDAAVTGSANFDDALHIITVIDSGTQVLTYVGGVLKGTQNYTRSGTLVPDDTWLGCKGAAATPSLFFNGYIGCGGGIGRVLTGTHTTANSELNKLYNWIAGKHGLATI